MRALDTEGGAAGIRGPREYHPPETACVSVLLLRELLDALYGVETRDRGRLAEDLVYLIRVAEQRAWPL